MRDLVAQFDGCSSANAGKVAAPYLGRTCVTMTQAETAALFQRIRDAAKPPSAARLGKVGKLDCLPMYHAAAEGQIESGAHPRAVIPYVAEAWAETSTEGGSTLRVYVNRTPVVGEASAYSGKNYFNISGFGLRHAIDAPTKRGEFNIVLNIIVSFMPITGDSKSPDLAGFANVIRDVVGKAIKAAHRNAPAKAKQVSQKDVVIAALEGAVAKASGGGVYRFSQRQLFYALRPVVMEQTGNELKEGNFTKIITDHESEHGEIKGMFRDNRGALYMPHGDGVDVPFGTLMVENNERPPWEFNKILYIEKQGFFPILKDEKWPERFDCALLTSKGYSNRAVRDLIDKLAVSGEPVQVFCVHDADSVGTMIYQTLLEETKARGARQIEVFNIGLEPWEAADMGLEAENFDRAEQKRPVADYVRLRGAEDGEDWADWLQEHRYELNAMTSPQFIAWLTRKMEAHGVLGKVVPDAAVIEQEARAHRGRNA